MDDTTLLAIIMDAVNNYTEPKYRKPQNCDFELNCDIEHSRITPHDKELSNGIKHNMVKGNE